MIAVEPIAEADKAVLWDDLQHYIAELAPFDRSVPKQGPYAYDPFHTLWSGQGRASFWAKQGGEIAGFAVVRSAAGATDMADFYIRPAFRRRGIGLEFARAVIARFPGTWTLSQFKAKTDSIAFWRGVIGERPYTERDYISKNGNARIEQRFEA